MRTFHSQVHCDMPRCTATDAKPYRVNAGGEAWLVELCEKHSAPIDSVIQKAGRRDVVIPKAMEVYEARVVVPPLVDGHDDGGNPAVPLRRI